jgi:hypothetical protein
MQRTLAIVLVALAAGCGGEEQPLQRQPADAPVVVRGEVRVEGKPVVAHVSLHEGAPRDLLDVPVHDELETQPNGRFALRSDLPAGRRREFFVFVNRTVDFADFCDYIALPPLEREGDRWVDARSGRPLPPLAIRLPPDHDPIGGCY